MFETVVPETAVRRSRKLFYETLPVSLAVHALAGISVLAANLWTVAFPQHSPKLYATYSLALTPPPPPPPPPLARPAGQIQPRAVLAKMPLVAPAFIPDEIPVVTAILDEEPAEPAAVVSEPAEGVEGGVEGGLIGGVIGGTIGGILDAPAPEIVEIRRDDPLPMGAISQEFPAYPEYARSRGIEDTLVVRYVIGKDGRVREVKVVKPPELEDFTRAALSSIRHWRFHPFRDEAGQAKEVVHELTVEFRIKRVRK